MRCRRWSGCDAGRLDVVIHGFVEVAPRVGEFVGWVAEAQEIARMLHALRQKVESAK